MAAETLQVILTIADNTRKELWRRRPAIILMLLGALFFLSFPWFEGEDVLKNVTSRADAALDMSGCLAFVFSTMLYDGEVTRRTIVAVMVHPVEHWAFLLGRLLGIVYWYIFVSIAVVLMAVLALSTRALMPDLVLVNTVVQDVLLGCIWIAIGGIFGALMSPPFAIGLLTVLTIVSRALMLVTDTSSVALQWAHQIFYFASLNVPEGRRETTAAGTFVQQPTPSFDWLRSLDNGLFAVAVLAIGAILLSHRDVPTRGGS